MIKKLLIANRGEIAVRIIHAARELGVQTVAVYSDADKDSIFVAIADESAHLGASDASESYLNIDKIIGVAKQRGADAIHPGYGFLSERAAFADACRANGIVFVGPSPESMRALGAKIEAKQIAVQAGVPITPGFFEKGATADQIANAADQIGYPVMLKASAGGGGRGMRIVRKPEDLRHQLEMASEEAVKAFGDGAMMVEKLVERPRHIEVQILADHHGNVVCLFERECSIQRRHQKIIEEAPSVVGPMIWTEMHAAVEQLVKAAGYTGAGTCEFMFDQVSGKFYFLEVNARLQVEHPVTEMISGIDLVKWQLRIGSGERLDLRSELMNSDRAAIQGHAIEARIVAEDPAQGFMPSIGKILAWAEPKRPGVRVDTGYASGSEISRFYDSLVAKVIAHGETRLEAINRLHAALLDFHILGVKTNIPYLLEILAHPDFMLGKIDTGFLEREFSGWSGNAAIPTGLAELAQSAGAASSSLTAPFHQVGHELSWASADAFRNA